MSVWSSNQPVGESVGFFAGDDHGPNTYIFAKNLRKYLKGDLELKYYPTANSLNHGMLRLQTSDEREFLLMVDCVSKRTFEGLGRELEWRRVDDTTFHSSPQA